MSAGSEGLTRVLSGAGAQEARPGLVVKFGSGVCGPDLISSAICDVSAVLKAAWGCHKLLPAGQNQDWGFIYAYSGQDGAW